MRIHPVDSHVHLDLIYQTAPERIAWLKTRRCTVVSWAYGENIHTMDDLKNDLERRVETISALKKRGQLNCFFLTGIHPRSIPAGLIPENLPALLRPGLEHPLCRGIGEIGLETGSTKEKEIFLAQLEFAWQHKISHPIRIGIHTPREAKAAVTGQILELLDNYTGLRRNIVVDHCNAETLHHVLDKGYAAGVSLSPPKTSMTELCRILDKHPQAVNRIMCNTDSGTQFYEDLIEAVESKDLPAKIRQQIFRDNAVRFFGLS